MYTQMKTVNLNKDKQLAKSMKFIFIPHSWQKMRYFIAVLQGSLIQDFVLRSNLRYVLTKVYMYKWTCNCNLLFL